LQGQCLAHETFGLDCKRDAPCDCGKQAPGSAEKYYTTFFHEGWSRKFADAAASPDMMGLRFPDLIRHDHPGTLVPPYPSMLSRPRRLFPILYRPHHPAPFSRALSPSSIPAFMFVPPSLQICSPPLFPPAVPQSLLPLCTLIIALCCLPQSFPPTPCRQPSHVTHVKSPARQTWLCAYPHPCSRWHLSGTR